MIGFEGLYLDTIEESLSPGFENSGYGTILNFPSQLARLLRFKNTFAYKMMGVVYPTGEDPNMAFARCLLLDNKPEATQARLGDNISSQRMLSMWDEWYGKIIAYSAISSLNEDYTSANFKAAITALPLTSVIFWEIEGRTLIITKSGYIGIGSPYAKAGDIVSVFNGASIPCVLRKTLHDESVSVGEPVSGKRDFERWEIIGNCFLHGFMDNEVASPEWESKRKRFWVV